MTRPPTIDLVVGYHKLKHPQFLDFPPKMARTNEQAKRTHIFGRAKLNSQALVVICILFDYLEEFNVNTSFALPKI